MTQFIMFSSQKLFTSRLFILSILIAGFSLNGFAQQPNQGMPERYKPREQSGSEPIASPNVIVAPNSEYRIGAGDVIDIRIEDAPELAVQNQRVSPAGRILMPYLSYLEVKGKTQDELVNLIADRLRGKYLKNPSVAVIIKQPNSQMYFIQGAVKRPSMYQVEGRPTLMSLINAAGGLADNHGAKAYITRDNKTEPTAPEVVNVPPATPAPEAALPERKLLTSNINQLFKGGYDQDVRLEPGDTVYIPLADVFFVGGEVNFQGEFPLRDGTTLRQAIALSGGFSNLAQRKNMVIFREDEKGSRVEIPINYELVEKGKSPDIKLMANDIVAVPKSALKSALLPILGAFTSGASYTLPGRIGR
jgi:polysaccharide biosynthesis/export protein